MSLHTTTLEIMVNNLCADRSAGISDRIESARPKLFNFDYPFPQNQIYTADFKKYFETAFINKYLFREIGSETAAQFWQRVRAKLFEIIPRYYSIFTILNKVDYDKLLDLDTSRVQNQKGEEHDKGVNVTTDDEKTTNEGKSGSKGATSTLPENVLSSGQIGNFTNVGYADSSSITRADTEDSGTRKNTHNADDTHDKEYEETIKDTGVNMSMSAFDMIRGINTDFNNYFENFLNEFKDLFMFILY